MIASMLGCVSNGLDPAGLHEERGIFWNLSPKKIIPQATYDKIKERLMVLLFGLVIPTQRGAAGRGETLIPRMW